jgi:hypothetical protein
VVETVAAQVAGCCPTWLSLTGVWATATDYGFNVLTVYKQMLDWAFRCGWPAPASSRHIIVQSARRGGPERH